MPITEADGALFGVYVPINSTMTLVAGRQDLDLEESADTRETSDAGTGGWRTFVAGAQEWSTSFSNLLLLDDQTGAIEASQRALVDAKRNRNVITLELRWPFGSEAERGDAIIEEINFSMNFDEMSQVEFSAQGTGPIQTVTV